MSKSELAKMFVEFLKEHNAIERYVQNLLLEESPYFYKGSEEWIRDAFQWSNDDEVFWEKINDEWNELLCQKHQNNA